MLLSLFSFMNRNWYIQPKTTFEELLLLSPVGFQNWFQNGLNKRLVVLFCLFLRFKLNENVVALQIALCSGFPPEMCVTANLILFIDWFPEADTMLYYKFLKDKKGELSQVLIATQSTTKGSKRVRLDISIQVGFVGI